MSYYVSEITLGIETKNYFDGRMNNWYILGPSSIFFPSAILLKFLKMYVIQQIKKLWP